MNAGHDVINPIAKASLQLRSLLMLFVAGLAFHVHALRIMNRSPLADPSVMVTSAVNPVVVCCAFATVVTLVATGAVVSTWLWQLWPFHRREPHRELDDYVPLSLARKLALLERDTLWIERTERAEAEQVRSQRYKERNSWLLFAFLVLFIVDLRSAEPALVVLAKASGFEDVQTLLWMLCVAVGGAWCALVLWEDPMNGWIEHPELAAKRESEFRASALPALASRRSMSPTTHIPPRSS